jgi:hypothetical protein
MDMEQASLEQRQRQQPSFFPDVVVFDLNRFVRTGVAETSATSKPEPNSPATSLSTTPQP